MNYLSLLARFRRPLALFIFTLGLAAPAAHAITADELLPANLVGKTLTFAHTAPTANTLDGFNSYTVKFTTATTYVRSGAGITTEGGTYSATSTLLTAGIDTRTTTLLFNNNWATPGSTTLVVMSLTNANGVGSYVAAELLNATKASVGAFTLDGSSPGGATTAPVITSATAVNYTLGTNFLYQATSTPASTSWSNFTVTPTAPVTLNATTGQIIGSFPAAGTYTLTFTSANATGSNKPYTVTVTAGASGTGGTGGTGSGTIASYAGTYTGSIFVATNGAAETVFTTFNGTVSTAGVLSAQGGEVTGTVNASGTITFNQNGIGMTTGTIANQHLDSLGSATVLGTTTRIFRIAATGGSTVATATAAPANLAGYRNKVGGVYQFIVTGASNGAIWGTDVYTDDSSVATAAVHAGVLAVGETKTVTISILPGQSSYTASTRNNIKASSWGAWSGSYSFAGASTVTGTSVASARPTLAPGYLFNLLSYAVGGRLVIPISVVGGGTYAYQWYFNGALISGATSNPYIIESLTAANAGAYTVDVTNSFGTTRLTAGTITVGASGSPVIALQPLNKIVSPGGSFALAVDASGTGNTYQWFRNGVAIAGETGQYLLHQNVNATDAGTYTVRITNASGSVLSNGGTVTLDPTASTLRNLSVRTNAGANQILITGITIAGSGSKRVLVRAVGPGLAQFGLGGTMSDPKLAVFSGTTQIAQNDNWDGAATTAAITAGVGAFPLPAGSKDAVIVTNLIAGQGYTVQVSSANQQPGIVLVEIYDADTAPTSKLSNVSVRSISAPGADVLIMGLSLQGTGQRTFVVRGAGPALAGFGVPGTLADPQLAIYDGNNRRILENDDWSSAAFVGELAQASSLVGAFAFTAGSKDASTLSLLDPGNYTVQVSGANSGTGEALVEVYEVP